MKKKILIISTSLYGGGAEKVLVTFLQHIDYTSYEVHLCLEYDHGICYALIPDEVKIMYLYENTKDWRSKVDYQLYRYFRFNLFEPYRIRKIVDKHYNAIISFVEGKPLKFHRYVLNRTHNNISWVHADLSTNHYTIGTTFSKAHEQSAYQRMDTVVFVSANAMRQFEKIYGTGMTHNIVIHNPIDRNSIVAQTTDQNPLKQKVTLIAIGRLSPEKGIERLLRVVSDLNKVDRDFDLWILGDGPMRQSLEDMKKDLALDNVHFLGFRNPPYPWLAKADMLISSSYTEAAPLVVCEALCLGIPVIGTDTAGTREMLEGGKWGILTEQSEKSLYEGILKLLDSSEERKKYSKYAIERSLMFDVDHALKQLYALIHSKV